MNKFHSNFCPQVHGSWETHRQGGVGSAARAGVVIVFTGASCASSGCPLSPGVPDHWWAGRSGAGAGWVAHQSRSEEAGAHLTKGHHHRVSGEGSNCVMRMSSSLLDSLT